MPQIGSWNKHTFEMSENLIRGFTDMTIEGACEVTEKNTKQQKYVERKYGEIPVITLTVGLNALVGVTDVMGESMAFVAEATAGEMDYFYLGSKKLLPCKVRLTKAEVVEITHMPGKGDVWISSKVKLTLKQGAESDQGGGGSGSSGSGTGGSQKPSVKNPAPTVDVAGAIVDGIKSMITTGINAAKSLVEKAKAASAQAKNNQIDAITSAAPTLTNRVTQINSDSAQKVSATTGRASDNAAKKITSLPSKNQFVAIK